MSEHPVTPTDAERATVASSLASFGVQPDGAELDRLAVGWTEQRTALDALYAVPGVRYAQPALRFSAEPHLPQWGEF